MKSASVSRQKAFVRVRQFTQRAHLWSTLIVGVFLLIVTTTGVAALYEREVIRATHPALFHVTPGTAIGLDAARRSAAAAYPGWHLEAAIEKAGAPYLIYGHPKDTEDQSTNIYIDPGTGTVNGAIEPPKTVIGWLTEVHYTLLADRVTFTYPAGTPEWLKSTIGATLSDLLLKVVALALMILVLSGAYLWWPKVGQWRKAFVVRRSRQQYVRDLNWHKVIGALSLPFLFMWALTGMNFYEPFQPAIKRVWYALTFTPMTPDDATEYHSRPHNGAAQITAQQAQVIAQRVRPDATFISYTPAEKPNDVVSVWVSDRYDAYTQGDWPGNVELQLDAYSGAVLHDGSRDQPTWGAKVYSGWFYGLHAASFVPWPLKLLWAAFGLTPLFLAFTGVRVWWHKRRVRLSRIKVPAPAPTTPVFPPVIAANVDEGR